MRSTQPPSALAPREDANPPQRAAELGELFIGSVFQTVAGLGLGRWDLGPCQPGKAGGANPAAPGSSAAAASGKAALRTQEALLGVCRAAAPRSQLRRRGRRSRAAAAHLLPQLHVPPSSAARGRHRPRAPRPSPEAPRTPPSLTYGGVVREGALVLVHPVPRPGHADRGHVRHQQLADVSCSHLPAAAAARHAEQGAPALHGYGVHPSGAEPGRAGALGLPAAAAAAEAGCAGDASRAGAGGRRGPRGGNGHPGPGAGGRAGVWGTLLFLIQWRIAGPAAAAGGALGSTSRSAPGRGRWRGALRPDPARQGARGAANEPPTPGTGAGSERGAPLAPDGGLRRGTPTVFSTLDR